MKFNIWNEKQPSVSRYNTRLGRMLQDRTAGPAQRNGHLEMIPLFGSAVQPGAFAPPQESLSLTKVTHYGQMILKNSARKPAIVPLHLGYFQQGAQNHAMCRSWLIGAGKEKEFKDACCIQASQGGYIKDLDNRFIVLPHHLRNKAYQLKGVEQYGKLWNDIAKFNKSLGLKNRGHLDEMKQQFQPELMRVNHCLEPLAGQTGAIFRSNGKILGIELAPDAEFWEQLHTPLIMYTYGPVQIGARFAGNPVQPGIKLNYANVADLDGLQNALDELQKDRKQEVDTLLTRVANLPFDSNDEQTLGSAKLLDVKADSFQGQAVISGGKPAYLSLFNTQN